MGTHLGTSQAQKTIVEALCSIFNSSLSSTWKTSEESLAKREVFHVLLNDETENAAKRLNYGLLCLRCSEMCADGCILVGVRHLL